MKILVLDDGIQGNTNQSIGIAESLQHDFDILKIQFRGPAYKLPGRKGKVAIAPKIISLVLNLHAHEFAYTLFKLLSKVSVPENSYDIVISTGSLLAPINLLVSKKNKSKSICVMTPEGIKLEKFDLLVVPFHDSLRNPGLKKLKNVFFTTGAPNRIKPSLLEEARKKLAGLIQIPENVLKIGIIIGGNDQNYFIDIEWIERLLKNIKRLNNRKFVFFLTVSRRTPADVVTFVFENTNTPDFLYKESPGTKQGLHYLGILGTCDIFLVTEDSVTMLSEVCSTGKPVIVAGVKRRKRKKLVFDATIEYLVKNGYCSYVAVDKLDEIPELFRTMTEKQFFPILNESKKCAEKIIELMNLAES